MSEAKFEKLAEFMKRVPAVGKGISHGTSEDGNWWVKFWIDINHQYAWHAVQEFACVVNYLSLNERLPTRFYPVSPAPYLNGGPEDFLSWIIESTDPGFSPNLMKDWLASRLPNPVDDLSEWEME